MANVLVNAKEWAEWIALAIATIALIHSIRSSRKFRRLNALQAVRSVAVPNLTRFNGILNAAQFKKQPPSSQELCDLGKLYAEVRDAYSIYRDYFSKASRREIDSKVDSLEADWEAVFSDNSSFNQMPMIKKMREIMKCIESGSR